MRDNKYTIKDTEGCCDFCKYFYKETPEEMRQEEDKTGCQHLDGRQVIFTLGITAVWSEYRCPSYERGRPKGYPTIYPEVFDCFEQLYNE